jgi:GT2 family glycosyltransferase
MDLSVITVTWNSQDIILDQIASVFSGCQSISYEQIIVDNASKDSTVKSINKQYPNLKVISNKKNIGFAAANNLGVVQSKARYYLFLNPDMQVETGSLDNLVSWMDNHKEVGVASCKLTDIQGKENKLASPRRFPKIFEQLALVLKIPHIFPSILDKYHMKDMDSEKEQEVDSVRGSFMIIRYDLVSKLGWAFDPRYFIWFEDVDICREAKKLGYKVMYTPIISCVDFVGQSFGQQKFFWKQYNFIKSMIIYFKKWGGH